jgi:hypothetical protein
MTVCEISDRMTTTPLSSPMRRNCELGETTSVVIDDDVVEEDGTVIDRSRSPACKQGKRRGNVT